MLLSTTNTIEGRTIKEYRGVVFGEVVNGIDFLRDISASIANFTGGRSKEYEQELIDARANALTEMSERAKKIGANAVIGVKVDYESIPVGSQGTSMMIAVASFSLMMALITYLLKKKQPLTEAENIEKDKI